MGELSTKRNVIGVLVDAIDYDTALDRIVAAAHERRGYSVSALAVHGVMTGVHDPEHLYRLNHLDLVCPDGQPVRWALNLLHRAHLRDRVYGPLLTEKLLTRCEVEGLSVYFYGSTPEVLARLTARVHERWPGLRIAGAGPSRFRQVTEDEATEIVSEIRATEPSVVFVGLGCPRQEVFAFENRDALECPVLAVGAAFDYHAGLLIEPPAWMQRWGLQWLYRLGQEPRRLWRRYVLLNPEFLVRLTAQRVFGRRAGPPRPPAERLGHA